MLYTDNVADCEHRAPVVTVLDVRQSEYEADNVTILEHRWCTIRDVLNATALKTINGRSNGICSVRPRSSVGISNPLVQADGRLLPACSRLAREEHRNAEVIAPVPGRPILPVTTFDVATVKARDSDNVAIKSLSYAMNAESSKVCNANTNLLQFPYRFIVIGFNGVRVSGFVSRMTRSMLTPSVSQNRPILAGDSNGHAVWLKTLRGSVLARNKVAGCIWI